MPASDLSFSEFQDLVEDHFDDRVIRNGHKAVSQGQLGSLEFTAVDDEDFSASGTVTVPGKGSFRPSILVVCDMEYDGSVDLLTECSCPTRYDCSHAAGLALLLASDPGIYQAALNAAFPNSGKATPPPKSKSKIKNKAKSKTPAGETDAVEPALLGWMKSLSSAAAEAAEATQEKPSASPPPPRRLLYVIKPGRTSLSVMPRLGVERRAGVWDDFVPCAWAQLIRDTRLSDAVMADEDRLLVPKLLQHQSFSTPESLPLEGSDSAELLRRLVATRRAFWNHVNSGTRPLTPGEPLPATLAWVKSDDSQQRTALVLSDPTSTLLPVTPPWYLAADQIRCGPVQTPVPPRVLDAWLAAPRVAPEHTQRLAAGLRERFPDLPLPAPEVFRIETIDHVEPVPILVLAGVTLQPSSRAYLWETENPFKTVGVARLEFEYLGLRVPYHSAAMFLTQELPDVTRRILRQSVAEFEADRILIEAGLVHLRDAYPSHDNPGRTQFRTPVPAARWIEIIKNLLPELRSRGWRIEEDPTFNWRLAEPEDWFADATPDRAPKGSQEDWFGVELGVVVDGQRINVLPLLLELLRIDHLALSPSRLAAQPHGIPLPLPDGRTLLFPADRARSMLGILIDLFDQPKLGRNGRLRLPRLRAAELAADADWRWMGSAELATLATRLRDFRGVQRVAPPPGLATDLRPYQQDGLEWLQFLREHELGGVLADDMGLGKTVQTIAHLLLEKISGRADRPSLVVAPTSLMTNWDQECQRFAPLLKVLVLHGLDRKDRFDEIPRHDVVLTTYPLLTRDLPRLGEHAYHCLILDEAQYIKNPKTGAAQAAIQIDARHRLCLTGTPLENHLGELWSLFHFLMPGFLGDELLFGRAFRRPIEKESDPDRRQLLARRIRPFLLRRRKDEVARELPPKTEIVHQVELGGAQRDLYETVRLAMHERIRAEVGKKGLSRSHIIILDALLKLRQICCHPRLLALEAGREIPESAKTDLLFELLPSLIDDGRRILLFSQFTSMLAILREELDHRKIPYVLLTGDTVDRATPIQRFQSGKVPLFLLSLKAGGTGLNLTAADTVIHYDPWWNPAVENQATDRAHRIGQDKQVFVYKLLTVGTVEEKIAAMQLRKRELVEGLLDADRRESLQITAEDLDVLFAPVGR